MTEERMKWMHEKITEMCKSLQDLDRRLSQREYAGMDEHKCDARQNVCRTRTHARIDEHDKLIKNLEDSTKLSREVSGGVITVWKKFMPVLAFVIMLAVGWLFLQWGAIFFEKSTGVKVTPIEIDRRHR